MLPDKKHRKDSTYAKMPPYLQDVVEEMLMSGAGLKEVQERVAEDGISWSLTSISQHYHNWIKPYLKLHRKKIAAACDKLDADDLDAATLQLARETVFDLLSSPGSDLKTTKAMFGIVKDCIKLRQSDRKISLLEQKAAEARRLAEDALNTARKGLSAETIAEMEERLKLL